MFCALKGAGVKITASILIEEDAQAVPIQRATFGKIAIDRTEARDEQHFRSHSRHFDNSLPF